MSTGGAFGSGEDLRQLGDARLGLAERATPCSTTSRSWSICSAVCPITVSTLAAVSASSGSTPVTPSLVIEDSHSSSSR